MNLAQELRSRRLSKYGNADMREFTQMFKDGAVHKIPTDLAPFLVGYHPQTDDELSLWIHVCLEKQGLTCNFTRTPNHLQTDLPNTCSHLEYMCDAFFERVGDCIVLGSRGSGKTLLFAAMLFLEALHKPGIELAHLGAIEDQAKRCYRYFRKMTDHPLFASCLAKQPTSTRAEFANGSVVEILVGTMAGVNGPHPQHSQIDEVELIDWAIMQEAFNMARSAKGYPSSTRLTSTRKKASGTMQRLLDEAPQRGFKIYQWNLWDTIKTCPLTEDDRGRVTDQQELYTFKNDKGDQSSCFVYSSCLNCPMLPACRGQAKTSNAGPNGVISIEDAIKNYRTLDREVWDAQVICVKPGRSNLIYDMFDPDYHIVDYTEMLKDKYGEHYQYDFDTDIEVYAGQDAGFGCPATVFLQVIDDPETGEQTVVIFDELYEKNIAPSKYVSEFLLPKHDLYNVIEWFCDPSNSQQLMAEMELQDLYTVPGLKNVDEGIDAMRALFSMGRLLIDKRCKNLIWELGRYEKQASGKPKKVDDHLCLTGDTTILTINGWKTIGSLVGVEGMVRALDETTGRFVWSRFNNVRCTNENAKTLEVVLESGRKIRCTPNHPFLTTERGWVQASELTEKDVLVCESSIHGIKIAAIIASKPAPVYNLSVPIRKNFVATDTVVLHNCDASRFGVNGVGIYTQVLSEVYK